MEDPMSTSRRTGCVKRKKRGMEVGEVEALIEERLKARAEKNWSVPMKSATGLLRRDSFERFEGGNDVTIEGKAN